MKKLILSFTICLFSLGAFSSDLNAFVVDAAGGPGTGSIDLTVGAGVAPFLFSWTGPASFTAGTEDISALNYGVYTVTVTDLYCGSATYSWFVDSVSTIGIKEIKNSTGIFVYPNPGNSQITVTSNSLFKNASFNLKNVSGQTVLSQKNINGSSFIFDITNQTNGIYFIEMFHENKYTRQKFIKD